MIYLVKPEPGFWRWFFVDRRNDPVYKWIVRLGFGKWRYLQFAGLVVGLSLSYIFFSQFWRTDPGILWWLWYTRYAPVPYLMVSLVVKLCMAIMCSLWIKRRLRQQLVGEHFLATPVSSKGVLRIVSLQVVKLSLIIYPVFLLMMALHRDLTGDRTFTDSLYSEVFYLSFHHLGVTWPEFMAYVAMESLRNVRILFGVAVAPVCGIILLMPARTLMEYISHSIRWLIVMVAYAIFVAHMPDDLDFFFAVKDLIDSWRLLSFCMNSFESVVEIVLSLAAIGISAALAGLNFSLRRLLAPGMDG